MLTRALGAIFGLCAAGLSSGAVRADDFYRGKTVTITVGLSAGGGYDLFARTVARHLGAHIPGEPHVVVANMPGAASLSALLWLESAAPRDGTQMVSFNHGLLGDSVLSPDRIRVDFRRFNWVGSAAEDLSACYMWYKTGLRDLDEIRAHGAIHFGQTAAGSSSDTLQHILTNILGLKIQTAFGYPGSSEVRLAVERGELDGDCGAWAVNPPEWVREKKIYPFIKNAPTQVSDMAPDVPWAVDAAQGDHDKAVTRLLVSSTQVGRPLVMSRDVPADRMAIIRKGFDEAMHDRDMIADLAKQNLPWSPRDADSALRVVEGIVGAQPDIVAAARKVMND